MLIIQPMSKGNARRASYERERSVRIGDVFDAHPELFDHRERHPRVLACLGDPFADVWFVVAPPTRRHNKRSGKTHQFRSP